MCRAHLKLSRIHSPEGKTIFARSCKIYMLDNFEYTCTGQGIELTRRFLEISISVGARWDEENISRRPNSPNRFSVFRPFSADNNDVVQTYINVLVCSVINGSAVRV